jgi:integrase
MATINFLYRSTKPTAFVQLRLLYRYENRDHVLGAATRLETTSEYWTKYHRMKRPKILEIQKQQLRTTTELNAIADFVLGMVRGIDPKLLSKKWLEKTISRFYEPQEKPQEISAQLTEYIDYYIGVKGNNITENTKKKCRVIKHLLLRYEAMYGPVMISEVDSGFKLNFEAYCLGQNYAPNTVSVAFKFIKAICNHAQESGLEISRQLKQVKARYVRSVHIYLTLEELNAIGALDAELTESLKNARDWLVISCFTAQRISDFMRFTKADLRLENGKTLLEFRQQKTGKDMTIPLHAKVLSILAERGGFPRQISDQKYNDYIKEVCRITGICETVAGSKKVLVGEKSYRKESGEYPKWELVTSHIGRRSFATNFYGKIPTSYLTYITGHATEVMFLQYIGKSNKDMALEMTNFF